MKKAEVNTPTLSACNGKDTHFLNETQILFEYLQDHVASSSMACAATGILQKSATRYKRALEKSNLLWEVDKKRCNITGRKVNWITTNPELVPNIFDSQLSLFEEGGGD